MKILIVDIISLRDRTIYMVQQGLVINYLATLLIGTIILLTVCGIIPMDMSHTITEAQTQVCLNLIRVI